MVSENSVDLNGMHVDNSGNVSQINREMRRRRVPSDPIFTKSTHRMKKEKENNEKRNRKRTAARARKTRQEGNTQVS